MSAADDLQEVLRRLRRIEDRQALADLLSRYGPAIDDRDVEALRELFTADATFDSVGGPVTGRDEVVDHYIERMRSFGPSYHIPHSQVVEFVGDDEATGVVCAHAELAHEDGAFWVALRYHDRYRREDGTWRFAHRKVLQLYAMPLAELVSDMGHPVRKRWPHQADAPAELPESLPSWATWVEGAGAGAHGT